MKLFRQPTGSCRYSIVADENDSKRDQIAAVEIRDIPYKKEAVDILNFLQAYPNLSVAELFKKLDFFGRQDPFLLERNPLHTVIAYKDFSLLIFPYKYSATRSITANIFAFVDSKRHKRYKIGHPIHQLVKDISCNRSGSRIFIWKNQERKIFVSKDSV